MPLHRITPSTNVVCLGVHIDPELTFAPHVKRVPGSGAMFSPSPPTVDDSTRSARRQRENASPRSYFQPCGLLQVFNSILHRVAAIHLRPFQSVLNAAARLIVRKRKFHNITPTLRDNLHCLPVDKRIEFQTMLACVQMSTPDGTTIPGIDDVRPAVGRHSPTYAILLDVVWVDAIVTVCI